MKRHRLLGAITILAGIPILALGGYLLLGVGFPATHWLILEKAILGAASMVGGVLLWRGHRLMYWAGMLAWFLFVVWSIFSFAALLSGPGTGGLFPKYGKDVLYLFIGIPALAYLLRELRRSKHVS